MESFSGKFYGLEKTFSERDSTIFIYYALIVVIYSSI